MTELDTSLNSTHNDSDSESRLAIPCYTIHISDFRHCSLDRLVTLTYTFRSRALIFQSLSNYKPGPLVSRHPSKPYYLTYHSRFGVFDFL